MSLHIIQAITEYGFMRRSLIACLALSLSLTPLGIFLLLRRMSLVGDSLSHAVLPGVAVGYLLSGSLLAMSLGGVLAGLLVALLSSWISGVTKLHEDSAFAGLYLGALALGVTLVSLRSNSVDLLHLLFGSFLAVDGNALITIGCVTTFTVITLAIFYRLLVFESFDSSFLIAKSKRLPMYIRALFMSLVVINLVSGFQILGTLMTVGLMMLPAIAARCWSNHLSTMMVIAIIIGMVSSILGLSWSWYNSLPAGPAIVLVATVIFLLSILFGSHKGIYPIFKSQPI